MISDRNTKSLHKGKLIYLYAIKRQSLTDANFMAPY